MTIPRENEPAYALARHRYLTIKRTIPNRLDQAAQLLDDALDLLARYGLQEALQPDPRPYQRTAEGLRAAANRVRATAARIPDPASTREPRTSTARHTAAPSNHPPSR